MGRDSFPRYRRLTLAISVLAGGAVRGWKTDLCATAQELGRCRPNIMVALFPDVFLHDHLLL
jgi:hypothetical protein